MRCVHIAVCSSPTGTQLIENMVPAAPQAMNILFLCSKNQWRSPTAEQVWRRHPGLSVRSAGTSPNARHPVSSADVAWADVIFAMEEKHKSRLLTEHRNVVTGKTIHVLDIPDDYRYMDPELVEQLRTSVGEILGLL
jgi:predicted protein tyrosine phosphatase